MSLDTRTPGESTPQKVPSRSERLKNGALLLTYELPIKAMVSLKFGAIFGSIKISKPTNERENILKEEESSFKAIQDLDKLPINGIIEVWTKARNGGYVVTRYQKLK